MDAKFAPVEQAITDDFLLALFGLPKNEVVPFRYLLGIPTKIEGVGVTDPTTTGLNYYGTSVDVTQFLVNTLLPDGK